MIAAKAGEQLAPFLPQIIPRLYRYQFDPNLSIRQAMTSIWDALVTDKTLVRADCCTFASIKKTNYKTLFVFRKKNGCRHSCLVTCACLLACSDLLQVDKYLKEILQDVISNLTNNAWRVRESRCMYTYIKKK